MEKQLEALAALLARQSEQSQALLARQSEQSQAREERLTQLLERWWGAVRGLAGNRVLGLSVGVDLLVGVWCGRPSSWGACPFTPHPPQADQYYTGISSTTAIIVGVGVGGVWVVRCRPRARTLAFLLAVVVGVMAAAHAPLAALTCGGGGAAGGPLMDGSTLALHRACSEGCYCDAGGAYQPVCVRDGPLMLPYFSPCHAGCPPPPLGQPLGNCTCGSRAAKVTPGPCHPCPTHLLHTCLSCLAASLVPVALLINLLLALRAVSKEDKTVALGLKLSLWSLGRLVGPLLVGALVGESCLVRGAACRGAWRAWVGGKGRLDGVLFV
ncbi:hypothetical protein O3P69_019485 [Scylla paramamosain]|uniref:Kazal-like domain-containing protein n=1 Tax=Scylla paramamosain TaxID=85552 RepID=A0AAW0SWV2_SCYPA